MKITHIESHVVNLPADEPLANGPAFGGPFREFVTVEIGTDDGVQGVGITFFGAALTATLKHAVEQLGALTIGEDPLRIEAIGHKLREAAAGSRGPGRDLHAGLLRDRHGAVGHQRQSAESTARDLAGRIARARADVCERRAHAHVSGRACAESGAYPGRQRFPADEDAARAAGRHLAAAVELARARSVREAIGPGVDLMCDINQRWSVHQAIDLGRRLEDIHFYWLEDVTTHDDFAGLARVSDALATPVAGGEYVYGIAPFRHMLEARSVDIVDDRSCCASAASRNWMKVAGMAEAFNLPVVSHLLPEIHVHLVAAAPNGLTVEFMPWSADVVRGSAAAGERRAQRCPRRRGSD